MAAHYSVVIQPNAEDDLERAYLYIKEDSPQHVLNWYHKMYQGILSLKRIPERCPFAPENDYFENIIRHLIIKNYRVLFTVHDTTVYILHIRRGSQKTLGMQDEK